MLKIFDDRNHGMLNIFKRLFFLGLVGDMKPSQPRNAGILGVPNASGPMSDAEGRKRLICTAGENAINLINEVGKQYLK